MLSSEEYVQEATFASLPRTTRGLPLAISTSPDGQKLVYCNGNSVFIRDFKNATECDIYTEHTHPTTVAKFSPSGFYVASGDQAGRVRVWDATQPTHILKGEECQVMFGPVRDIAWSEDSKRLAVVGEARERFGHVFLFDGMIKNGNLSGQSRPLCSVDFRPSRPFRVVTGSEDNSVALFEGPPFKFMTILNDHTRFVYCVRYNVSGSLFASAGADGRVILHEGATGNTEGELIDEDCKGVAHNGSVFGLCWSPDGQFIATASGDKTVKIWNATSKKLEKTFVIGSKLDDQQLSVVWSKCFLAGVSLSGCINYLDAENGIISNVFEGHNKPITSLAVYREKSIAFTADFEGNITRWFLTTGASERIQPMVHSSQVSGMCVTSNGNLISVGWDDTIAFTDSVFESLSAVISNKTKLPSQPRGLAINEDTSITVIACQKSLVLFVGRKQKKCLNIDYEGTCVSVIKNASQLQDNRANLGFAAVGGQDWKVHIYMVLSGDLVEVKQIEQRGAITSISCSPNNTFLLVTDSNRGVKPYCVNSDFSSATKIEWLFHTARVNCAAWSPNSRYVASGSVDTNVIIWDMENVGEHPVIIRNAHKMSAVNCILWLGNNKILTVGQDSVLKIWSLKL